MNKSLIALITVIAAGIVFLCGVQLAQSNKPAFGGLGEDSNIFFHVATSSLEQIGTTNVVALATSTGRTWALISNNGATNILCSYTGAPVVGMGGFVIAASSTKQISTDALYTGAINCVSQAGTVPVFVQANQ